MPEQAQEIPQMQPVQPVPAEPKKKPSFLKIIVIPLIVILLITGGVYAGMQLEKRKVKVWTEPPLTEVVPQSTEIVDETANWETYTNLNFTLKYPSTLVASQSGEILLLYVERLTPNESETFVPNITIGNSYKKPANFTDIISWAKQDNQMFKNLNKDSEVILGDNKFVTFESDSGPSAYAVRYLIDDYNNIYSFSVRIVGSHEQEGKQLSVYLPQILSTFKFTQ